MKHPTDDFDNWKIQQANLAQPFPYIFPKMPPRFRFFRAVSRGLFLLQWISFALYSLTGLVMGTYYLLWKTEPLHLMAVAAFMLLFFFACGVLRFLPGLFWRCPCCKTRFPYYRPSRGLDVLMEKDCLEKLRYLRIAYQRPKFCPLFFPAICPVCQKKFFRKNA